MPAILVADASHDGVEQIERAAAKAELAVIVVETATELFDRSASEGVEAVVVAVEFDNETGLSMYQQLADQDQHLPVILVANKGNSRQAIEATKLGALDYLEVMTSATYAKHTSKVLHRALNCGFKLTPVGGEDSISNLHATPAVGAGRFYAYLGDKLTWEGWIEAIRKGRTFVTNGPLIGLEVNGQMVGSEIHLPQGGGEVELTGWLHSAFSLQSLEVVFRGEVIETLPNPNLQQTEFQKKVPVTESGWFTLRARSGGPVHPIDDVNLFAETAPIFVYVGGQPIRSKDDAEYFLRWIDEITRQAEAHPGWRSDREKKHVLAQFAQARKVFEQRAAEAVQ